MALILASILSFLQTPKKRNVLVFTVRFFLPFLFFVLSSCQSRDSAEYIVDDYLYRLSNSLQVEPPALPKVSVLLAYPSRRVLQKDIPRININLLEFLRLSECELQRHIGQRNGALGRVMESTQQLIYDAKFVALAAQCLSQLNSSSALSKTLIRAYDHKRQYLPSSIWNASFASKEFSYLFSLGAHPLSSITVRQQPLQLTHALTRLHQTYGPLLGVDAIHRASLNEHPLDEIEAYYQVIESSKRIGELRLSLQSITRALQQADEMLSVRINARPLCRQQQSNAQFTIVNNVFYKYYIGQVQPYIAALHKQSADVFVAIDALVRLQEINQMQTAEFTFFWNKVYRSDDGEWQSFNQAVEAHTVNWKKLLKQCGGLPS
jgi:hypothetical protein